MPRNVHYRRLRSWRANLGYPVRGRRINLQHLRRHPAAPVTRALDVVPFPGAAKQAHRRAGLEHPKHRVFRTGASAQIGDDRNAARWRFGSDRGR